jgi:ribosome-associated protein
MINFQHILEECSYKTSRSGGAGGQHVNKVETKVEILWKPASSKFLNEKQLILILEKLAKKIDAEGFVHFTSQESRSQVKNKGFAQQKLVKDVITALHVTKKRKATSISKAGKEKRLLVKRVKAETKQNRKKVQW